VDNQFRFGLEAEFMLADHKDFKPLWYKDVTFKTLDELFTNIPLDGIPSLEGLSAEPPHQKLMPFIVEGYGVPDPEMNIIDAYPKGIEIRTPVCLSIQQTLDVYKTLYQRVRKALDSKGLVPIAISHHPVESKFSGPQNKRRHDFWMWAQEVMTTYGPDINVSFPAEITSNIFKDLETLNAKVNYYAPAMAALSLASPFFEGKPWMIKDQRGKSYRTFKRSIIAPAIELHVDERFRIEFKVFEMTKNVADFEAYFHLVLALFLCDELKGQSGNQERIYDLGSVARFGLNAEGIDKKLGELFELSEKILPTFGFSTNSLKSLHQRFEKREHISDEMLQIFDETQSIPAVLKKYSNIS
jgi:hypothetical protein